MTPSADTTPPAEPVLAPGAAADTAVTRHALPLQPVDRSENADAALFRAEAVAEQQALWLGTVLLAPRISQFAMAAFAAIMVVMFGLLLFASYTRTARVGGLLVPDAGLVRVFAPLPGVLVKLHVHEGDAVAQGAPLFELSTELQTAVGDARRAVLSSLRSRQGSLIAVRRGQEQVQAREAGRLRERLASVKDARSHLEEELALNHGRLALAKATAERQQQLFARNIVPIQVRNQADDAMLQLASEAQSLERQKATLEQDRASLVTDLDNLPVKNSAELAETDREIAALGQDIAEAEARRQIVVTAPEAGVVSSLQADLGSTVGTAVPLMGIIPAGSRLQAQLFAPTRAVGFIAPGQHVLVRFAAFPYQKFGRYEGVVASVSRAALSAAELPQQLASLTSLYDGTAPIYRVAVTLGRQNVIAYGKPVDLQPGMQLEADILVEKRRLIEWVLDPLYTISGRWHS